MPYKKRISQAYKKKRAVKRYAKKRTNKMMNVSSRMLTYNNRLNALPPCLKTKMYVSMDGYWALGTLNGNNQVGEQFLVKHNSVYHPFNTPTAAYNPLGGTPALALLGPNNFITLCNASLYQSYRVLSSCIKVSIVPNDTRDVVDLTIFPAIAGVATQPVDSKNQPYARSKVFNAGKGSMVMSNSISTSKFLGVAEKAIEYDLSGNFIGNYNSDPNNRYYWYVTPQLVSAAASLGQVSFKVEMCYDVLLWNNSGASNQT